MPQTFVLPHEYTAFVAAFYAAATTANTASKSTDGCAGAIADTAGAADTSKFCITTAYTSVVCITHCILNSLVHALARPYLTVFCMYIEPQKGCM
jgi:hypothetical protein